VAGTNFIDPGGMNGLVGLERVERSRVEPSTYGAHVMHSGHYTNEPTHRNTEKDRCKESKFQQVRRKTVHPGMQCGKSN
jgi:hypothetical protein